MKAPSVERRTQPRQKNVLDRLLDPVAESLNVKSAAAIAALRLDAVAQARIDVLAAKANDGTLTSKERSEYETYLSAMDFITILQSKARKLLADKR